MENVEKKCLLGREICPGFTSRDDAVAYLCGSSQLKQRFEELPAEVRQEMIGYCVGENGLLVTRDFVRKPEELMEMYSDILRVLDRNTERNMVTDLQSEVQERDNIIREQREQLREMKLRLIRQLQKRIKNGKTLSEIADDLEMEEQEIASLYERIVSLGPDKDAQEIILAEN